MFGTTAETMVYARAIVSWGPNSNMRLLDFEYEYGVLRTHIQLFMILQA